MEKEQTPITRIAILGPECSGKTTLAQQLAHYYSTQWVPEYARQFVEQHGLKYTLQDILTISEKQIELEKHFEKKSSRFLFCDTDTIYLKVWCDLSFNTIPQSITDLCNNNRYDFYLLTQPDLPWESNPVRELPHKREELFIHYENEIKLSGTPYAIVSGFNKKRLECAVEALKGYIVEGF